MSILDVTYHPLTGPELPRVDNRVDTLAPSRGPQVGSSEQLDFTGGQVLGAIQQDGMTARCITDADCRVMVTDEQAPALTVANSAKFPAGLVIDDFTIPAGHRLVVASA